MLCSAGHALGLAAGTAAAGAAVGAAAAAVPIAAATLGFMGAYGAKMTYDAIVRQLSQSDSEMQPEGASHLRPGPHHEVPTSTASACIHIPHAAHTSAPDDSRTADCSVTVPVCSGNACRGPGFMTYGTAAVDSKDSVGQYDAQTPDSGAAALPLEPSVVPVNDALQFGCSGASESPPPAECAGMAPQLSPRTSFRRSLNSH